MELWKEIAMALWNARHYHFTKKPTVEAECVAFENGIDDTMVHLGNLLMAKDIPGFNVDDFEYIATMGHEPKKGA